MTQTNQTLIDFIQKLPLADKITALKSLIVYDTQDGSFDDLILSITPTLDYTKITPLRLILEMGKLNDKTQNVQRFVNDSCSYLPTLIQVPDLFNPEYNSDLLFTDFVTYIQTHSNEMPYIQNVIRCTISKDPSLIDFFLKILNQFAFRFSQARLAHCLSELQIFYGLLSIDEIRYAFCQAHYFFQIMTVLFMKSIFPLSQGQCQQDFSEYIGDENKPNRAKLGTLEELLSSYYLQLKNIMMLLCRSNTIERAFQFIREFFLDMKRRANDEYCWMARYNFESTLMEISFLKRADWEKSDPFTPYMKDTLAPIGSEYELSVVGKYSWVDPNNLTLDALKLSYEDNDEDIQNDQKAWEQKLREVSNQKPKPQSNFFFATLQALELSSVNFLNIIENISSEIHYHPDNFRNKILKNFAYTIEVLMCLSFKSNKVIDFLRGALRFLQITAQYNFNTKKLPSRPPIAYQRLPEYILASCAKLVNFYNQVGLIPAANDVLFGFIQMESSLFMNKKFVRNPIIANDIVKFFANIASQPMGRGNCHLIVTDTVIEEVYPAVVDFFSRVEKTGTSREYYDKMNMRRPCLLLMTFWMKHRECRDYYIKHYKDKANTNFLYHLISDLSFYLDNCFSSVAQIREMFGSDSANTNKITIEKNENQMREDLKSSLLIVKDYYDLVSAIASFAPYAFDEDKTAYMISTLVVGVFRKAANPENLLISRPDEIEYDPYSILASFISLISMLVKNQNVLSKFTDASLGFNQELSDQIMENLKRLSQKSKEYEVTYHKFQAFIEAKNNLDVLVLPDTVDIPDELADLLTGELLLNPITLPSGNTYNKSTLDKLQTMNDPFNQTPFTPKDLVPDEEKKKAAWAFFKEHAVPSKKA